MNVYNEWCLQFCLQLRCESLLIPKQSTFYTKLNRRLNSYDFVNSSSYTNYKWSSGYVLLSSLCSAV